MELQNAGWTYKDGSRAVGDYANPTLEELIEACGEIVLWKNKDVWCADFFNGEGETYIDQYFSGEEGKSPTEAVAKLWLSLNKK